MLGLELVSLLQLPFAMHVFLLSFTAANFLSTSGHLHLNTARFSMVEKIHALISIDSGSLDVFIVHHREIELDLIVCA